MDSGDSTVSMRIKRHLSCRRSRPTPRPHDTNALRVCNRQFGCPGSDLRALEAWKDGRFSHRGHVPCSLRADRTMNGLPSKQFVNAEIQSRQRSTYRSRSATCGIARNPGSQSRSSIRYLSGLVAPSEPAALRATLKRYANETPGKRADARRSKRRHGAQGRYGIHAGCGVR